MTRLSISALAAGFLILSSPDVTSLVDAVKLQAPSSEWQKWGPYRPGLYFGVRPNIPETLLMGLMWANGTDAASLISTLRDKCEQDDGVTGFGWTVYDPRVGGSQVIHDAQLGVNLMTDFVKNEDGSGWAVRVSGEVRPDADADTVNTSLIFHVAMERAVGSASKGLMCERLDGASGRIAGTECRGKDDKLGPFVFRINADPKYNVIKKSTIRSRRVGEDKIWQAKSVYSDLIKVDEKKDAPGAGNIHFLRYDFEGSFSATFSYRDEGGLHNSPDAVTSKLSELRSSFASRVDKVFPRVSPFRDNRHASFNQALLSNLLGGLGYFHGDSKVSHATEDEEADLDGLVGDRKGMADTKITTTKKASLLAFTPSRPFFPRGFLWDEGFHLLPVIDWDLDLAIAVFRSWLKLADKDGWIAREQILGPEARSRVPEEFQVQHPYHANPPTLIALVLPALLSKLYGETPYHGHPSKYIATPSDRDALLRELYPALAQHYFRFRFTQAGDFTSTHPRPANAVSGEGYRWRGRTSQHTLPSGLDDYPRPEPPSRGELHADALAWVGSSAAALQRAAERLSLTEEAGVFQTHIDDALHNLEVLHWDDKHKVWCDATTTSSNGGYGRHERVCRVGYASVLPALVPGLLNASHPRLPAVLDVMADPSGLWSEHGLRSLSKRDVLYGKGEDYWRGKVWVNVNTLAVRRLRELGMERLVDSAVQRGNAPGVYRSAEATPVQKRALELGAELRRNVVSTVYKSWAKTGFAWEQYHDDSGAGLRTRAFTGWTACVLLLAGLDFTRSSGGAGAGGGGDGVQVPVPAAGTDESAQTVEQTVGEIGAMVASPSRQHVSTLLLVAMAILAVVILRRRIARQMSRLAGYWRSRTGGSGRYEAVIDMEARQE